MPVRSRSMILAVREGRVHSIILLLFCLSILNAAYQICLVREIDARFMYSSLRFSSHIIINLALVGFGVGAIVHDLVMRRDLFRGLLVANGVLTLGVLAFMLRGLAPESNENISDLVTLAKVGAVASVPLVLYGVFFVHLLKKMMAQHKDLVGILIGVSLLGTMVGYVGVSKAVLFTGVHSMMLAVGLMSIVLAFSRPILSLLILLAVVALPAESFLDRAWLLKPRMRADFADARELFSGWSLYHKVHLYEFGDGHLAGFYNSFVVWTLEDEKYYEMLYGRLITPDSDVLIIGSGGGAGVMDALAFTPRSVTAVEIDPLVVRLLQGRYASYNSNLYLKVKTFVQDGRAFLETGRKRYDLVSLEASVQNLTQVANRPVEIENHMYTVEGIRAAWNRVTEDGVLLIGPAVKMEELSRIAQALRQLNIPFVAFQFNYFHPPLNGRPSRTIAASRDAIRLNALMSDWAPAAAGARWSDFREITGEILPVSPVTDDRPFFHIFDDLPARLLLLAGAGLLCVLGITAVVSKAGDCSAYFFSIGVGFVAAQYFVTSKLRSLLSDPVQTILVMTGAMLICAAWGSIRSGSMHLGRRFRVYVLYGSGAAAWLFLTAGRIPHGLGSNMLKGLLAVASVAPFAVAMGTFFPLGLKKIGRERVSLAFFCDVLGTAAGLFLFYGLALKFGYTSTFGIVLVAYLVAALVLWRNR